MVDYKQFMNIQLELSALLILAIPSYFIPAQRPKLRHYHPLHSVYTSSPVQELALISSPLIQEQSETAGMSFHIIATGA